MASFEPLKRFRRARLGCLNKLFDVKEGNVASTKLQLPIITSYFRMLSQAMADKGEQGQSWGTLYKFQQCFTGII